MSFCLTWWNSALLNWLADIPFSPGVDLLEIIDFAINVFISPLVHCFAFSNLISACLSQIEYSENILPVNIIGAIFKAGVNDVNVLTVFYTGQSRGKFVRMGYSLEKKPGSSPAGRRPEDIPAALRDHAKKKHDAQLGMRVPPANSTRKNRGKVTVFWAEVQVGMRRRHPGEKILLSRVRNTRSYPRHGQIYGPKIGVM